MKFKFHSRFSLNIFKRFKNRNSFKKVFSTNGLILTVLLGILVNMFSDSVADSIAQQRYEEILSYELRSNLLVAGSVFTDFNNDGRVLTEKYLSDEVYKAGLSSGDLLRIETEYLIPILAIYGSVPTYNELIKSEHDLRKSAYEDWFSCLSRWEAEISLGVADLNENGRCSAESNTYESVVKSSSENLVEIWSGFYDNSATESAKYNPTQNRLRSPLFRILMGTNSLEVLK